MCERVWGKTARCSSWLIQSCSSSRYERIKIVYTHPVQNVNSSKHCLKYPWSKRDGFMKWPPYIWGTCGASWETILTPIWGQPSCSARKHKTFHPAPPPPHRLLAHRRQSKKLRVFKFRESAAITWKCLFAVTPFRMHLCRSLGP
jgi:hypothetical protein